MDLSSPFCLRQYAITCRTGIERRLQSDKLNGGAEMTDASLARARGVRRYEDEIRAFVNLDRETIESGCDSPR
jgi:hypothetical protein